MTAINVAYINEKYPKYPSFSRKHWRMVGAIGVVTGFERVTRLLSIFQKVGRPIDTTPRVRGRQMTFRDILEVF